MQHSTISLDETAQSCTAAIDAGITALVRVLALDLGSISRVMDGGAMGIIVPDIQNAENAETVVRASKYPPFGNRSVSGAGILTSFQPMALAAASDVLDQRTMVIVQIESSQGLEQAGAIGH